MTDKALLEAANLLLEAVERDGDPSYAHLCMLYRSARTKAQAEQSASATSVQPVVWKMVGPHGRAQINSGHSSFVEWTERPDSWPERSKT